MGRSARGLCSEWICRMRGGLVSHILIIPAASSLPPLRGAAVGRAPTILQNDWFYTRISNFFQSPFFSPLDFQGGAPVFSLAKRDVQHQTGLNQSPRTRNTSNSQFNCWFEQLTFRAFLMYRVFYMPIWPIGKLSSLATHTTIPSWLIWHLNRFTNFLYQDLNSVTMFLLCLSHLPNDFLDPNCQCDVATSCNGLWCCNIMQRLESLAECRSVGSQVILWTLHAYTHTHIPTHTPTPTPTPTCTHPL